MSRTIVFYDAGFPLAGDSEAIRLVVESLLRAEAVRKGDAGGRKSEVYASASGDLASRLSSHASGEGSGSTVIVANAGQLERALDEAAGRDGCFVNLHAPIFPKAHGRPSSPI
ncbi:hypothetical protein [Cohnella faecalis]|uniref:hypothetical protein n=1 Tax=Cohnella faecalis TaxID=2315694 RepID=UPI0026B563F0|nr:hypothetical protein [Cohnella faecalis]